MMLCVVIQFMISIHPQTKDFCYIILLYVDIFVFQLRVFIQTQAIFYIKIKNLPNHSSSCVYCFSLVLNSIKDFVSIGYKSDFIDLCTPAHEWLGMLQRRFICKSLCLVNKRNLLIRKSG